MFGLFANKAKTLGNKYAGKTDFLEGLTAIAALVAAADRNISDEEVLSAIDTIKANKVVAASFTSSQVETLFDKHISRAKTIPGKLSLRRELDDVAKRGGQEMAEDIFATGLEVAYADGDVSPEEKAVLIDAASRLGVNAKDFGL